MSEFPAPDVKMPRRRFLATAAPALAGAALARVASAAPKLSVMTVRGRIDAERLGATLMHEHVMVDFIGADKVSRNRYDPEQVFTTALPHLKRAAELGCRTFVDCTPAWLGRDVSILHRLSVAAAALTHLRTGLTIGSHTGDGVAAMQQLDILEKRGVSPKAFIWIHAQSEKDKELHVRAAKRGCWVEFDGVNTGSVQRHLDLVKSLADAGFIDRTLISMDAGWYHIGEPGGGNYRSYESLFTEFLPALRKDFSEAQVERLIVGAPQQALALRVRRGS